MKKKIGKAVKWFVVVLIIFGTLAGIIAPIINSLSTS